MIQNRIFCIGLALIVMFFGCRKKPKEIETQLHRTARIGDVNTVRILIEMGSDVNARNEFGSTPLYYAAFGGYIDIVKLLIANGAKVNALNNENNSPLSDAALGGSLEVVKLLISKGANIEHADNQGWTPLHSAAYNGHTDIVKLLVDKGVNINIKTKDGKTAFNFANHVGFIDIVQILQGDLSNKITDDGPYNVIITDTQDIQKFLKSHVIDFDEVWIPEEKDIEGFNEIVKIYLRGNNKFKAKSWFSREYILASFRRYNREYSGFIKDGTKYLICQMINHHSFYNKTFNNKFSIIHGFANDVVRVVLDVEKKTVIKIDCEWQM